MQDLSYRVSNFDQLRLGLIWRVWYLTVTFSIRSDHIFFIAMMLNNVIISESLNFFENLIM